MDSRMDRHGCTSYLARRLAGARLRMAERDGYLSWRDEWARWMSAHTNLSVHRPVLALSFLFTCDHLFFLLAAWHCARLQPPGPLRHSRNLKFTHKQITSAKFVICLQPRGAQLSVLVLFHNERSPGRSEQSVWCCIVIESDSAMKFKR